VALGPDAPGGDASAGTVHIAASAPRGAPGLALFSYDLSGLGKSSGGVSDASGRLNRTTSLVVAPAMGAGESAEAAAASFWLSASALVEDSGAFAPSAQLPAATSPRTGGNVTASLSASLSRSIYASARP
jgi:hypothetical protein